MAITIPLGIYSTKSRKFLTWLKNMHFKYENGMGAITWGDDTCNFLQEPDGEIVLKIDKSSWRRSSWDCRWSTLKSRDYFLSRLMKSYNNAIDVIFKNLNSDRFCNNRRIPLEIRDKLTSLDIARKHMNSVGCQFYAFEDIADSGYITIGELKLLIDVLIGRKRACYHATPEMIASIIGSKRNPLATEMETARREEIQKLNTLFKDKKYALEKERDEKIRIMREETFGHYAKLINDELAKHNEEISRLEKLALTF